MAFVSNVLQGARVQEEPEGQVGLVGVAVNKEMQLVEYSACIALVDHQVCDYGIAPLQLMHLVRGPYTTAAHPPPSILQLFRLPMTPNSSWTSC